MVTEQEVEELKADVRLLMRPLCHLVQIQCTKPPDIVKRTAELLSEVGRDAKGKQLKGQWCMVSHCCLSIVMWYLQ